MRKLLPLLILPLVFGCHGRFKKNASTLGAARAEVITVRGPSVATPSSGGTGIVAAAFDITQAVRAGNIAAHISSKVDPEQVNDAFVRGFADQLGDGPPFAYDANARPVLQFELVDWGLEMYSFMSPGVYNYDLLVRGFDANGKKIYKARFRCVTNAAESGWVEMSPFVGADNPNKIKNLPPEAIQGIFDATAEDCGRQVVSRMRYHAG